MVDQQQQSESKGKMTNNERNMVVSFIQFLRQKISKNECNEEQAEALEVATQCLEGAFNLGDKNYAFQPSKTLIEIFKEAEGLPDGEEEFLTPTENDIEQANRLKEEGNELVKAGRLDEAVQKYNEAIKLNRYPIYFCNRAAAYCRLEQFDLAIQDCRTALALDPSYAKAYGRMGVALSCQNRYEHAVEAYKKALELDPENESYKNNLAIAEEKFKQAQEALRNNPQAQAGMGLMGNLGNLFNNPDVLRMTSQMMQDPNVQSMMGQMMQAMAGGGGGGGAGGLENMVRMGEQLTQQMQQQNPELVDQLRRQFGFGEGQNPPGEGGNDEDGQNGGNNPGPGGQGDGK